MKIAYIGLKGMPMPGGIEKLTEEIGSRLALKGHEIVIYTSRRNGGETQKTYRGMAVRTVPSVKTRTAERLSSCLSAAIAQSFERGIDIVHLHDSDASLYSFIPKILGRKVVAQAHGLAWKRTKFGIIGRSFNRIIEPSLVLFTDGLTVVSKVQRDYFRETYHKENLYIPTGANIPRTEAPELIKQYGINGDDYILFAARLVREKGLHYLIQAYNKLNTDLKLVIAGDAQFEDKYKAELKELSKGNKNIIFTGFATGRLLNELFSNCYLFVLPSVIEGLPTALLEAMSFGNCCLVSDIPENLEALGGFGYSFRNRDVEDLAEKLNLLIGDSEAVKSAKDGAREHVLRNYSWDDIADRFEKFYEDVLLNRFKYHES